MTKLIRMVTVLAAASLGSSPPAPAREPAPIEQLRAAAAETGGGRWADNSGHPPSAAEPAPPRPSRGRWYWFGFDGQRGARRWSAGSAGGLFGGLLAGMLVGAMLLGPGGAMGGALVGMLLGVWLLR